ncbi:accessory gene regulator B family protein [Oceanospirillum beijerinckii]|nr:accessory gene regulator B family protein [Oceanospirillum beijerinckii]
MSQQPVDKSNRPSRSPESRKKRNLSFFITVIAAIAFAVWQINNG